MALTWVSETTPTNGFRACAWSPTLNLFAAGGAGNPNKFMTSPDGVVWTLRTKADTRNIQEIVWSTSLNLFVAISGSASNQCIFTSPDGITWTLEAATPYGAAAAMRGICWNPTLARLVAVGSAGQAMYSDNGTSWTASSATPDLSSNYTSVTFAPTLNLFVAVANTGNIRVMTSPDGITWTGQQGFDVSIELNWTSITVGTVGGVDVLVAVSTGLAASQAMRSTTATSWAVQVTPTFTGSLVGTKGWERVAYASSLNLFVAVANLGNADTRAMQSADGITWESSVAASNNDWFGLAWSPALGFFAATSISGTTTDAMINAKLWFFCDDNHYVYDFSSSCTLQTVAPVPVADETCVIETITDGVSPALVSDRVEGTPPIVVEDASNDGVLCPGFGCTTGGDPVLIHGRGFGDDATVTFGGTSATSVVVVNSTKLTCVSPAHASGVVDVIVTNPDLTASTITGGYEYGTPWWTQFLIVVIDGQEFTFEISVQQCDPPETGVWVLQSIATPAFTWWLRNGEYVFQVDTPGDGWAAASAPTAPDGWFSSPVAFGGSVEVLANSRPKDPREWANINVWAAANTGMLGGSPAASVMFQNRMIYAANDYTTGTHYPPIRVFDGSFDHELCQLPPTPTNTVPKAVMSMLAANGTIYLSTFDSGTTSANWLGRVFQLDLNSGVLTQLGAQFAAGEMPYALAFHMGRLWCGTNNGIGTVGKIYYFRPGIDTTWVLDHSLATDSVGGVDALISYKGRLFVGSDGAAGTFSKILVRDTAGVYTTSHTASGGTARVNNGHLAFAVFGENLYASYWNNDTTAVSLIKKFDNSSWSTVFTGATTTLRPYIVLFQDDAKLFAIGGGHSLSGALLRTPDGTTWTNLSAQLPVTNTLLPIYGVEIL